MSNYKTLFGAALSTLLFSGAALSHGVQNDAGGDIVSGHSSDHKDSVLTNPSKAQMPVVTHSNHRDDSDVIHRITVHMETLKATPSKSYDNRQVSTDNADDSLRK